MQTIQDTLETLKNKAYKTYKQTEKPLKKDSLLYFSNCITQSYKLIIKEKEIITFAILQFVFIALGYYLWVQILDWIPEEVWEKAKKSDDISLADIILLVWTFICVGLTTYPLGILTACMGAAHFLHENNEESSIAKCLRIVLPNAWTIWIFSWIDGWWTVERILERLPKKRNRVPLAQKLINEAIYQSWKIASLAFLPALIIGRGINNSYQDSLKMLKTNFKTIGQLRLAYSIICWIFGIASYIGAFFMVSYIFSQMSNHNDMHTFYTFIGIPIFVSLFFIQVIFRPIYILSACRIYSNYIRQNNIPINLPTVSKFTSTIIAFIVLAIIVCTIFLYKDTLIIAPLTSIQ